MDSPTITRKIVTDEDIREIESYEDYVSHEKCSKVANIIKKGTKDQVIHCLDELPPNHRSYICFKYIEKGYDTIPINIINLLVTYEPKILNYKFASRFLCANNIIVLEEFEKLGYKLDQKFIDEVRYKFKCYDEECENASQKRKENLNKKRDQISEFLSKRGIDLFPGKRKLI